MLWKPEENGIIYLKYWKEKKNSQYRILCPVKMSFQERKEKEKKMSFKCEDGMKTFPDHLKQRELLTNKPIAGMPTEILWVKGK